MPEAIDTKSLEKALFEKKAFIDEGLATAVKVDGNNVEISAEAAADIKWAMTEATEIKSLLDAQKFSDEVKAWGDMPVDAPISPATAARQGNFQRKSLGEMFVDSSEFKQMLQEKSAKMGQPFELEAFDLPGMGRKDSYSGMVDGSITPRGLGSIQFDPMVPRAKRIARVRDLFPVAATTASLIDFFRVLGFTSGGEGGNAASVTDRDSGDTAFGLKPKSGLAFQSAQAPVRTIAHWEAAHRNALDDTPQLRSIIDNELLYGLALEEDRQIIDGSGSDDELLGILNTPGTQSYTQAGGELKVEALRRAATKAILANYPSTGYVMHPYDWEDVELSRASDGGDGQFIVVTNVAIGAETRVWRQPVVETAAMPQGTFLTGAFGLGVQLYDRQQANVRVSDSHADLFVRNAIAVLAEERIAIATKRPESLVVGSFSDAPTS